jgi:hypothetical protein
MVHMPVCLEDDHCCCEPTEKEGPKDKDITEGIMVVVKRVLVEEKHVKLGERLISVDTEIKNINKMEEVFPQQEGAHGGTHPFVPIFMGLVFKNK